MFTDRKVVTHGSLTMSPKQIVLSISFQLLLVLVCNRIHAEVTLVFLPSFYHLVNT